MSAVIRSSAIRRRSKPIGRECDELFAKIVKFRDGRCRRCGSTEALQAAHVVSRRYHATRWDESNCVCLCRRCHFWQTTHPLEGDRFFAELLGEAEVERLRKMALAFEGGTDYKLLRATLRARLGELEAVA